MMESVVRTSQLTKKYGDRTVVDRLSLDLGPGEVFGLLGPNGAGKTTTILMLLGLTEPTRGTVRVFDKDPMRDPLAVKRRTGYLPDAVGFYENLTAAQNLRFTAELNRIPSARSAELIGGVLDEVGLAHVRDDRVSTFSRGMRQRLGIADALLKEPRLLILDEPTTAIDPEGVTDILALIRRLADERGVTVLLSSHLLHQVQSVCDDVAIFIGGRVVAMGTPHELAARSTGVERIEVTTAGELDPATIFEDLPIVEAFAPGRAPRSWVLHIQNGSTATVVNRLVQSGVLLTGVHRTAEDLEQVYRELLEREKAHA
jgi:ABC-2 type transport system ATP-binding protein